MAADEVIVFRDIDPALDLGANGDIRILTNIQAIYASIENLLLTLTGERVMLRSFPGALQSLLFDPLIANPIKQHAENEIIKMIEKWDDRVRVSWLDIIVNQDSNTLTINTEFYIKGYENVFKLEKLIR